MKHIQNNPRLTVPEIEILQTVASRYDIALATADRCYGGFSGSHVYHVTTLDGHELALRCMPEDPTFPVQRLRLLHQLLRHVVVRHGLSEIPLPLPLSRFICDRKNSDYLSSGELLTGNQTKSSEFTETLLQVGSVCWHVEPWKAGTSKSGSCLTRACLISAAETLQKFYLAAIEFAAMVPNNPWFHCSEGPSPAVARRLEIVRGLMGGQLQEIEALSSAERQPEFRDLWRRLHRVLILRLPVLFPLLQNAARLKLPLHPVIRDLWCPHVLFLNETVSGLIDLTACATDHISCDLARLQRSWFNSDQQAICSWLEVFERVQARKLNTAELQVLDVLDESAVLLSPLRWIRQRQSSISEPVDAAVMSRLRELVDVAENYQPLRSMWIGSRIPAILPHRDPRR